MSVRDGWGAASSAPAPAPASRAAIREEASKAARDALALAIGPRIAALLRQSAGLEVELLGTWGVEHAVAERIGALNAAGEPMDAAKYLARVERDPAEQQWLIEAVVIPETWFFRHQQSFDFIVASALARLSAPPASGSMTDAAPRVLRIASVPCSTGEEPYSIAMALLDAGISPDRFVIDAIDISHAALTQARRGLYGRNAFRSTRPGFQARYFDRVNPDEARDNMPLDAEGNAVEARSGNRSDSITDAWQIKPLVRRCVTFRPGNLVTDRLFTAAGQYDFVLCRNVLIYFDRPTQHAVMTRLRQALREDGHLLVGPAEAALVSRFGMDATPAALSFAFHMTKPPLAGARLSTGAMAGMSASAPGMASPLHSRSPRQAARPSSMPSPSSVPSVPPTAKSPFVPKRAARAMPHPTTATSPTAASAAAAASDVLGADAALARARQLADAGQLDEAEAVCRGLLIERTRTPSLAGHPKAGAGAEAGVEGQQPAHQARHADVYCLLGLIADARGQAHQAREHFRRAVYLNAAHADALLQLATHLSRDGDEAAAERLLSRARRARPDLF